MSLSQDGRKNLLIPGRGPLNDGVGLLQVVLLAYDSKGERHKDGDQYAAIRFPASYEDAMSAIQQSLGPYLKGGPKAMDAVELLCPMFNIDDEWIWAKADRKDWDLVIEEAGRTRKILAIRQPRLPTPLQPPTSADATGSFNRGPVVLAYGKAEGGVTRWSQKYSKQDKEWPPSSGYCNTIDRPVSYEDAVKLIIKTAERLSTDGYNSMYEGIKKAKDIAQLDFKFYAFTTTRGDMPTTDAWIEFPANAYNDNKIWRDIVPEFHQILGFTLHPKAL